MLASSDGNANTSEKRKSKIMVVDDETIVLAAIRRIFENEFMVFTFESSEKALLQVGSILPELIISDYQMPGLNGLEFFRQAKAIHSNCVNVLLSGNIDVKTMGEAINGDLIDRFFLKPWDNELLYLHIIEDMKLFKIKAQKNILEQLAITDPVTQVGNHRYFQDQLKREIERAKRESQAMSLVMIDVDNFKSLNDRFGHPAGDQVLGEIAQFLLSNLRLPDTVCRYGGDEFTIILPNTDVNKAAEVAERIRKNFESGKGTRKRWQDLSLSIGISAFPASADSPEKIIYLADQSLYQAKNLGKNRCLIAENTKAN